MEQKPKPVTRNTTKIVRNLGSPDVGDDLEGEGTLDPPPARQAHQAQLTPLTNAVPLHGGAKEVSTTTSIAEISVVPPTDEKGGPSTSIFSEYWPRSESEFFSRKLSKESRRKIKKEHKAFDDAFPNSLPKQPAKLPRFKAEVDTMLRKAQASCVAGLRPIYAAAGLLPSEQGGDGAGPVDEHRLDLMLTQALVSSLGTLSLISDLRKNLVTGGHFELVDDSIPLFSAEDVKRIKLEETTRRILRRESAFQQHGRSLGRGQGQQSQQPHLPQRGASRGFGRARGNGRFFQGSENFQHAPSSFFRGRGRSGFGGFQQRFPPGNRQQQPQQSQQ